MCIMSPAEPFHWEWAFVEPMEDFLEVSQEEEEEEEEEDEEEEALPPTASSSSTEHWCICGARLNPAWECFCVD